MRAGALWLLLSLWGVACGDAEEVGDGDAACDYACPLAADETCGDCAERIATCCYGGEDSANGQKVPAVMAVCEADPGCRACCEECGAMSCTELVESGACPVYVRGE